MSDKISVVYIGPKPFKKDTVAGTRTVFPRHMPVPVEADIAYRLTEFPRVWIYADKFEQYMEEEDEKKAIQAQLQAEQEAKEKAEIEETCMEVSVHGQTIDISKFNTAKLNTLVESSELNIEPKDVTESLPDYRIRVRDALRERQEG